MSDEVWNIDVKSDAIASLQNAYDSLTDALECADEMGDEVTSDQASRAQQLLDELIAHIEHRR